MSITDELREYATTRISPNKGMLEAIADRIDAEHQKAEDEWRAKNGDMWLKGYAACHEELMDGHPVIAADLEKAGWVRLPVDADGVPIRVGDEVADKVVEVDELAAPRKVTSLYLGNDGWWVYIGGIGRRPDRYRHHHAPTVEDVLREMADRCYADEDEPRDRDAIVAEYAAKLRLAGDAE